MSFYIYIPVIFSLEKLFLVYVCICSSVVHAATPNVIVSLESSGVSAAVTAAAAAADLPTEWMAKRADFGSTKEQITGIVALPPVDDPFLCKYVDHINTNAAAEFVAEPLRLPTVQDISSNNDNDDNNNNNIIVVVPRGECTFERKSIAAQILYNAVGIIIADSLEARYGWNETTQVLGYPFPRRDYECDMGRGFISSNNITAGDAITARGFMPALNPPQYQAAVHDAYLDMDLSTATCPLLDNINSCPSNLCLVVGQESRAKVSQTLIEAPGNTDDTTFFRVCCAWDNPLTMQPDQSMARNQHFQKASDNIISIFMTIRQSQDLWEHLGVTPDGNTNIINTAAPPLLTMTIRARPSRMYNSSMIIMWIIAVLITGATCWYAASDYRYFGQRVKYLREKHQDGIYDDGDDDLSDEDNEKELENNIGGLTKRKLERERRQKQEQEEQQHQQRQRRQHEDLPQQDEENPLPPRSSSRKPPKSSHPRVAKVNQDNDPGFSDDGIREQQRQQPSPDLQREEYDIAPTRSARTKKSKPKKKSKQNHQAPKERFDDEGIDGGIDSQIVMNNNESIDVLYEPKTKGNRKKAPLPKTATEDKGKPKKRDSSASKPKKKKKKRDDEEQFELYSLPKTPRKGRKSNSNSIPPSTENDERDTSQGSSTASPTAAASSSNTNTNRATKSSIPSQWSSQGAFELQLYHVAIFAVVASLMLFLLFFFNLYNGVTVLYGIGCAGAVSHFIFGPCIVRLVPRYLGKKISDELNTVITCSLTGYDVISQGLGFIWSAVWLWYGLTHYRPSTNWFFWMTMNVFGACFCFLVLSSLKLNSIKIATILMITIFIYDIFFVFITPLLFDGRSIMIVVASGGRDGDSTADDFCIKYPDDKECTGIDFLPMLLLLPRINDYLNRSVLLGLGDIVLPGFLIAFGARLDAAKRLLADYANKADEISDIPTKWYEGYFPPLMVAYGIGLFFAYLAVVQMEIGQPALLYIVPCCLATIFFLGRRELREIWEGAKPIRLADKFMVKQERAWNRQRMQRQLDRWNRKKAAAENQFGNDRNGNENSSGRGNGNHGPQQIRNISHRSDDSANSTPIPSDDDVCIERKAHAGTQAFRRVVRNVAKSNPETAFTPRIYKQILHRLKERTFFHSSFPGSMDWQPMTKSETFDAVAKYYEEERAKFAS